VTSYRKSYRQELMLLTAYVMSIDGDITQKEINFVHWFLEKNFGKKELYKSKKLLSVFLTKQINIKRAVNKIDYEEDERTKIQILNYLIKLATIDGFLSDKEFKALKEICSGFSLHLTILKSLLGTHSFITENQNDKREKKFYKKQDSETTSKQTSNTRKLQLSYSILGLPEKSTVKEIKKAYRKMVLLYHPDKIIHLDAEFKRQAKQKYQKVNEAYDYLKLILKFK